MFSQAGSWPSLRVGAGLALLRSLWPWDGGREKSRFGHDALSGCSQPCDRQAGLDVAHHGASLPLKAGCSMGKVSFSLRRVRSAVSQLTVWGGAGGAPSLPDPVPGGRPTAARRLPLQPECIRRTARLRGQLLCAQRRVGRSPQSCAGHGMCVRRRRQGDEVSRVRRAA